MARMTFVDKDVHKVKLTKEEKAKVESVAKKWPHIPKKLIKFGHKLAKLQRESCQP